MLAGEVRTYVLSDHAKLRERLDVLERISRSAAAGGRLAGAVLRAEGESLLVQLSRHMSWEDEHLVPVLRDSDSWGEIRCTQLATEHREQRELLRYALRKLRDEGRPAILVARNLLDLVDLLRADMTEEESVFLDERVVRDDVVGVDVFSG